MNKDNKVIIIIVLIILCLTGYIIYNKFFKENDIKSSEHKEYEEIELNLKKYDVNEYNKLSISNDQMSKIYLADYQGYLRTDMEKAYSLVDASYAKIKCNNIDTFKNMINNMKLTNSSVSKYLIVNSGDYKYYVIVDNYNNTIVFKVNGVMDYTVYLDNETVVINK